MKTLVTAIQKGGQGKTFVTCHLAFDAYERELRTVVLDLDLQGNASTTLGKFNCGFTASGLFKGDTKGLLKAVKEHSQGGLSLISADAALANIDSSMELAKAATALRECIAVLSEYYDLCLIDTAPALGKAMSAAVLASDYMLSPIELEAYSLQGMKLMNSQIDNLRKYNTKLKFLGMVPNKVDARKPRHVANLAALRAAYPDKVMPVSVGLRDSIAEALGTNIPVWEIKKTAARVATKEVRALAQHVFKKMEIAE
jgi:chromosome partitioning protein